MSNDRPFTQWSPDTCDCILQYYNDDTSYHATVQACDKHAANQGSAQHLADVLAHNRKKNAVLNHLVAHGVKPDTVIVGYDRSAPVDNDPVIVQGAKAPQLQSALDNQFGAGAVIIR